MKRKNNNITNPINMKAKIITLSLVLVVAISIVVTLSLPKSKMFLGIYDANSEMRKTDLLNKSPYAIFGDSSQTLMAEQERTLNHTLEIGSTQIEDSRMVINMQTGLVQFLNENNHLVKELLLKPIDIARFLTVDRFAEKYADMSPYQYAANNPIKYIDVNGDSIWVSISTTVNGANGQSSIQTTNYYYGQNANGTWGFVDPSGNLYSGNNQFVNDVSSSLGSLQSGGNAGNALVSSLAGSADNVMVLQSRGGNSEFQDPNNPQYDSYVRYNPNGASPFQGQNYVSLGHELAHTQDRFNGTLDQNTWFNVTNQSGQSQSIPYAEIYATHIENQIRSENSLPLRTHYAADAYGNGSGTSILFNNSNQSRFYDSRGIVNPNYRPIKRRKQTPFTY